MANPHAGEVELVIDGEAHVLKLTLGALAELETTLKSDTLIGLIERFENGAFSARDVLAVVLAGFHGAGNPMQADTLLAADIQGGLVEAARVAATLLARAFALPEQAG